MSKRSLDDLIRLSKSLLKLHGTLSTAFLMRKFKVEYEEAQKIMQAHGLPIYVTVEEHLKCSGNG
jgi:hypothetical protein